jgi:hypothetical protein
VIARTPAACWPAFSSITSAAMMGVYRQLDVVRQLLTHWRARRRASPTYRGRRQRAAVGWTPGALAVVAGANAARIRKLGRRAGRRTLLS